MLAFADPSSKEGLHPGRHHQGRGPVPGEVHHLQRLKGIIWGGAGLSGRISGKNKQIRPNPTIFYGFPLANNMTSPPDPYYYAHVNIV